MRVIFEYASEGTKKQYVFSIKPEFEQTAVGVLKPYFPDARVICEPD